jgi:hypothetical protein
MDLMQMLRDWRARLKPEGLDTIRKPEIKNDEFYATIEQLSAAANIRTVLEIGSSSGAGSTEAFVKGLRRNPNHPTLFCLEISRVRFRELQRRYANAPFVKCYNMSSVPLDQFPTEAEVAAFYNAHLPRRYALQRVLSWLRKDAAYLLSSGVPQDGLRRIKEENGVDVFDMVLIDGSEFTGRAELDELYGAAFTLLDDTTTFKNSFNYQRLRADSAYVLVKENQTLRNGYAVFQRRAAEDRFKLPQAL